MDRDEWVQYVTKRIAGYYTRSRDERKEQRIQARSRRAEWQYRWFGMVPFAFGMWLEKMRKKRNEGG